MSLSRIQSLRLAAVLEDCSDQLDIVGLTLIVQINREQSITSAQERARLTKLRIDSQCMSQQILELHQELEERQSFTSLQDVVELKEQERKTEVLRREAKQDLEERKQSLRICKEEFQRKNDKLREIDWQVRDLKHQLNEQSSKIANKKKIVEKSTELQLQRTQKETMQAEELLEVQRELLHEYLKEEARIHEESEKFLQNRHEELQKQLQHWQQCTKQMLEEKEQQLNSVSCKRTVNLDRLSELRRKYRELEQVVFEDRVEQEMLRQELEKARTAVKIQAWWRGCMVRRGLGPFKKPEDDKKGKKKEGKKKKK